MKHITVAYATMSDYYYICVSMVSAIRSAAEDTFYDFVVLTGSDFTLKEQAAMREIMSRYPQHSLAFFDVSRFRWKDSHSDFIAKATYYRLVLPLVLDADRCLYLDGDTLVCEDLQELYRTDLSGVYVAGVRAPGYYWREYLHIAGKEDLPLTHQYINAGVQLMNLDKMRQDRMTDRFMELMHRDLQDQDQDTMNAACYGHIKFLPFRYNVMTKYAITFRRAYYDCFSPEELVDAYIHPTIIHYADRSKPWNTPGMAYGEKWWDICKGDENLYRYFRYRAGKFTLFQQQEITEVEDFFQRHDRVYCYGAGDFGHRLFEVCKASGFSLEGFVVSDGQGLPKGLSLPVQHLSELLKESGAGIVLAMREAQRQGILSSLEDWGRDHVLSPSDGFFLEAPLWAHSYRVWRELEKEGVNHIPTICIFLSDPENQDGARKLLADWKKREELAEYRLLVILQEIGAVHEIFHRAGVSSLAIPYRLMDPPYQDVEKGTLRDSVSASKWLAGKLSVHSVKLLVSFDRKIDMGERLAKSLGVRHVFVNSLDEIWINGE